MNKRVLFIDDDENILASFRRNLRTKFQVETASSPEEGLQILRVNKSRPFAVVVSDLKMPKMSGLDVLAAAQEINRNTIRVMLTGYADVDTAITAINEGNIFRFLTKPCPPDVLSKTLNACVQQYQLVMAEKELLRGTLQGSVKVLTDVLTMTNPDVFGQCERVKNLVSKVLAKVKVEQSWQVEVAAMLVNLGYIALPDDIVQKALNNVEMSEEEAELYMGHPDTAAKLIGNIPRLDGVAEIIKYQYAIRNGNRSIPEGTKILNMVLEFIELDDSTDTHNALTVIKSKAPIYGMQLIDALQKSVATKTGFVLRSLNIDQFRVRMVLDEDVVTVDKLLLLKKGQELNEASIMRLVNYGKSCGVSEPIKVLVPETME